MEQSILKFPFKWEERKPVICDKVFFVPLFYDRHQEWSFPLWENEQVFGRKAPLQIEYCSGNGAWIIEKAKAHPEYNWLAVEKRFHRVRKIWSKMKSAGLTNLFIVCGEALTFTKHYVSSACFERLYINFPDPWPKGRHSKHRLIQDAFMTEMARVSQTGAVLTIVTDHTEYAQRISRAMLDHPAWASNFPEPYFITEWEGGYGTSFFDELWRRLGRTIHYLQFSNTHVTEPVKL